MPRFAIPRLTVPTALLIALALIAVTAGIYCGWGTSPSASAAMSNCGTAPRPNSEISQHLADWYTYSHVLHGIIFYWLLWALFRGRLSVGARLVLAVLIEGAWEIFENTPFIINRYRAQTISLNYFGDSVINSVGDMLAMVVGFLIAARLPPWVTVLLLIATEIGMLLLLRDNLLLNIIMLIYPLEWIRQWQAGG